jgi:cytochrome c oxidase subunit 2
MSKKTMFISLPLIVGLLFIAGCSDNSNNDGNIIDNSLDASPESHPSDIREFNVNAFRFGYEPSIIKIKKGDKVRINVNSIDVPHGFAIDEYNINLYLDGLKTQTVEFIADKAGTFPIYCSVVCGSGHSSMRGKLIVEE